MKERQWKVARGERRERVKCIRSMRGERCRGGGGQRRRVRGGGEGRGKRRKTLRN